MFGYIRPDLPWLFKKDETLYNAVYCGLCKSIGEGCGQCARTALTYDLAFVSALAHNICGADLTIKKQRCVLHLIKRRPIAQTDALTVTLGCINTALAYYKLCDDRADGDGRRVLLPLYARGFKRAGALHPAAVKIVEEQLGRQSELEKEGCQIIDMAAEPTAVMMEKLSDYVLGERSTDSTRRLFYSLGKWVYLADALDDYDKDVKKGAYNVLYNAYRLPTLAEAVQNNREELEFVFNSLFAEMRAALAGIKFYFNHDLTDNIILRGIPLRSRELLNGAGRKKRKGEGDEQKKS